MLIIPYVGVVFSFVGPLSLDRYHFDFEFEENANISAAIKSGSIVTNHTIVADEG